jgi:flagellar hook-associated protein 2
MKYSRLTDTFTIAAASGGADSSVKIENISGNAFGEDSAFMIDEGTHIQGRCDSIAEINGTTVTRDSNEYTVDGITFELNKVTEGTDEEVISFRVKRDYSATTNAISSFVDAFNTPSLLNWIASFLPRIIPMTTRRSQRRRKKKCPRRK